MNRSYPCLVSCTLLVVAAPFGRAQSAASIAGASAAESNAPGAKQRSTARKEIVLPIEGMSCVACVARVKKEISAKPGVTAINVDLAERNARIAFDSSRISAQEIAAAIDKLGYKAGEPKDAPRQDGK